MSLAEVLRSMKVSPVSPAENVGGNAQTRTRTGVSPVSPISPEKHRGVAENQEIAPDLETDIRRMAAFYQATVQELDYMLDQARRDPAAWREIVNTSKERWGWGEDEVGRHPWLSDQRPELARWQDPYTATNPLGRQDRQDRFARR